MSRFEVACYFISLLANFELRRATTDTHKGPHPATTPPLSLRQRPRLLVVLATTDTHKGPHPATTPPLSLRQRPRLLVVLATTDTHKGQYISNRKKGESRRQRMALSVILQRERCQVQQSRKDQPSDVQSTLPGTN